LFNIEYCDGEDLINLYWSFWSILQVGSNIAIFGVMLQLWIVLGNVQTPSWAVALGTPVLVFAALGWVFREIGKQALKRIFRREIEDDRDDDNEDSEREGTWGLDNWLSRTYVSCFKSFCTVVDMIQAYNRTRKQTKVRVSGRESQEGVHCMRHELRRYCVLPFRSAQVLS